MSNKRDLVKEAAASTKNLQVNEIHSKFCVLNLLRYEYIAINAFIKELKAAWDKFDLDGNGTVSIKEVDEFLKNLNIRVPLAERKHIEQALDR